jgi:hypothetical protein|tara:strand:- start:580 stop:1065 length:486 start_codon:yes stop_codon:yes gene_type:complete
MALAQVPFRTPFLQGVHEIVTREWVRYLQSIVDVLNRASRKLALVSATGQTASVSATTVDTGSLDPAVYRVSYSARITTAASTSSSLTVTISWVDGDVAQSQSGAAMTGNTTATQQNASFLIHVGPNALVANDVVTYATTYASSGATAMQYSLYVMVESMA